MRNLVRTLGLFVLVAVVLVVLVVFIPVWATILIALTLGLLAGSASDGGNLIDQPLRIVLLIFVLGLYWAMAEPVLAIGGTPPLGSCCTEFVDQVNHVGAWWAGLVAVILGFGLCGGLERGGEAKTTSVSQ
jgi:hypothetical protein